MNEQIAQLAALTCHANAFLGGRDFEAFFPDNSTCRFCDCIEFLATGSIEYAATPDDWIHALPDRDVDGVRLHFESRNDPGLSDRLSAGFVGGGRMALLEVRRYDGMSEFWAPKWQVQNEDAADRRIWHVAYRLQTVDETRASIARGIAFVRSTLRERLEDIRRFAVTRNEQRFEQQFTAALNALDNPVTDIGFHNDIALPGQLSADVRSMLKSAIGAWVFGGMGSWNDMSFAQPLQTEYENLSDGLFNIIHEALESSINSTFLTS